MPTFEVEPFQAPAGGLREAAGSMGYLFLRGLVEAEAALEVGERVRAAAREAGGWGSEDTDPVRLAILRKVLPSEPFQRLRRHPAIRAVLEEIWQGPVLSTEANMIRIFPPGSIHRTTGPHQDSTYVRAPGLWIAWMALEECPLELGPLAVIPGSHRQGLLPRLELAPQQVWATSPFQPGDGLLFHGCTIHRACENLTPEGTRISADFRYLPCS